MVSIVKGMSEAEGEKLISARGAGPFVSLDDFVRRANIEERTLKVLAEAGAFESLGLGRRDALWEIPRLVLAARTPLRLDVVSKPESFRPLDSFDNVGGTIALVHTARDQPTWASSRLLTLQGLPDARTIAAWRTGAWARYAGVVICRQRPGTASGVTFMTLEDETGFVNVVVWTHVLEAHRILVKTASFLGVTGKLQVEDGVTHLIADSLWAPALSLQPEAVRSRDFH